ncbi:CocE/NonD family hydrolase [Staphylococcus aureus]
MEHVVVKVALRGSDKSKGVLSPWSKREAEDYYEVIEWAANQSWSNGNIGTNGVSYLAVTQWWHVVNHVVKSNDSLGRLK